MSKSNFRSAKTTALILLLVGVLPALIGVVLAVASSTFPTGECIPWGKSPAGRWILQREVWFSCVTVRDVMAAAGGWTVGTLVTVAAVRRS